MSEQTVLVSMSDEINQPISKNEEGYGMETKEIKDYQVFPGVIAALEDYTITHDQIETLTEQQCKNLDYPDAREALRCGLITLDDITQLNDASAKLLFTGEHIVTRLLNQDRNLVEYFVYFNELDSIGAKCFANALARNKTLKSLTVRGMTSLKDKKYFAEALVLNKFLTSLKISLDKNSGDIIDALISNKSLRSLFLYPYTQDLCNTLDIKKIAKVLIYNTTLTSLNLRWRYIAKHGTGGIEFKDTELLAEALKQNTTLKRLNLDLTLSRNIGLAGAQSWAEALRSNGSLTFLRLASHDLGPEGAQYFLDALANNNTLTSLDLCDTKFNSDGIKQLMAICVQDKTLTSLNFVGSPLDVKGIRYIADGLMHSDSVTSLYLRAKQWPSGSMQYLGKALANNITLKSLDLNTNRLSLGDVKHLANALRDNCTLTSLELAFCLYPTEEGVYSEGVHYFTRALAQNNALRHLNMRANRLNVENTTCFADVLLTNTTLTSLNLSNSQLDIESAQYFAQALAVNKTLTSLIWSPGKPPNVGVNKYIFDALAKNKTLTHLDMDYTVSDVEDVQSLAKALPYNKTLTLLELKVSNFFNVGGLGDLAEGLASNTMLTQFKIPNDTHPERMACHEQIKLNRILRFQDYAGFRLKKMLRNEFIILLRYSTFPIEIMLLIIEQSYLIEAQVRKPKCALDMFRPNVRGLVKTLELGELKYNFDLLNACKQLCTTRGWVFDIDDMERYITCLDKLALSDQANDNVESLQLTATGQASEAAYPVQTAVSYEQSLY